MSSVRTAPSSWCRRGRRPALGAASKKVPLSATGDVVDAKDLSDLQVGALNITGVVYGILTTDGSVGAVAAAAPAADAVGAGRAAAFCRHAAHAMAKLVPRYAHDRPGIPNTDSMDSLPSQTLKGFHDAYFVEEPLPRRCRGEEGPASGVRPVGRDLCVGRV